MNKTLTALVMTGAVALGACNYDRHTDKGERVRFEEQDKYSVTVTDQESRRIGGTLPREVDIWAQYTNMTPFRVVGEIDNALAPNATFTSGYVQFTSADEKCSWGPDAKPPLCTATEVKNAQQMLTKYSAFVAK